MMGRWHNAMRGVTLLIALLIPGVAAFAQDEPAASTGSSAPRQRSYFRAYATFDSTNLAAADTFEAVIGKRSVSMWGGGGELLDIWQGLFIRVAGSSIRETGSRAEVFDGEVISLGIPLTVELRPLEIAAGWRLRPVARRIVPYVGGGLLRLGYKETSEFALAGENVNTTYSGLLGFGGVEVGVASWAFGGAEVQYRSVPDGLGDAGLSEAFGEDNLGGLTFRVLFGIRR